MILTCLRPKQDFISISLSGKADERKTSPAERKEEEKHLENISTAEPPRNGPPHQQGNKLYPLPWKSQLTARSLCYSLGRSGSGVTSTQQVLIFMEETRGSFQIQRNAPSLGRSDLACPEERAFWETTTICLCPPSQQPRCPPPIPLPQPCRISSRLHTAQKRQLLIIYNWRKTQHLFKVMMMQSQATQIPGPIHHRQYSLSTSSFSKCPLKNCSLNVLLQV